MSNVSITINGRIYEIGCDEGQEGRIAELAACVDQRLQQIARSGAAYNDAHPLVLTALILADETFEAKEAAKEAKRAAPAAVPPAIPAAANAAAAPREDDQALAKLLEQITRRIEGIAAKVQAA